jgi:hypothetical protein
VTCGPCPVFASYTLAFVLQLRKKHVKTSVRVDEKCPDIPVTVVQYTITHKQYTEQHNETEYTELNIHNNNNTQANNRTHNIITKMHKSKNKRLPHKQQDTNKQFVKISVFWDMTKLILVLC